MDQFINFLKGFPKGTMLCLSIYISITRTSMAKKKALKKEINVLLNLLRYSVSALRRLFLLLKVININFCPEGKKLTDIYGQI